MLNYTMPVWVSILAYFFLSEALTKKKICGIALSVLGVGILMNVDVGGKFSAMLIPLAAAVAWAVGNIIMKAKLSKLNPLVLTTWQMAIGAVLLCIYTFTFGEIEARWTLISVACLLYNGIIASAFAFFLWAYILDNMEASKASISACRRSFGRSNFFGRACNSVYDFRNDYGFVGNIFSATFLKN